MPRANRFYLRGYVWHVTQRCHRREFLLDFKKDKINWLHWMYKAKKQFQISILNYTVTSNHIHLLLHCDSDENHIARAMHLVSGKIAWDYNQRKGRKGSFWEDRYHATVIQTGQHLLNCMLYIDTNMVRAGTVMHPKDWPYSGYQEMIDCKQRKTLINKAKMLHFLGLERDSFKEIYDTKLVEYLRLSNFEREIRWTESIGVGGKEFVEEVQDRLNIKSMRRKIRKDKDSYLLRECENPYFVFLPPKKKE